MKDAKARLDRGAAILMNLIRQAERGAVEACDEGHWEASAHLHRTAAYLRMAYAEGRMIEIDGERPEFGGNGK